MKRVIIVLKITLNIVILFFALALIVSAKGKTIQTKLFGTYIPQKAIIKNVFLIEKKTGGQKNSSPTLTHDIEINASYNINNKNYSTVILVKSFDRYKIEEAEEFKRKYKQKGEMVNIFISPNSPENAVINRIDEFHIWVWTFVFLIIFILIFRIIWLLMTFSGSKKDQTIDFKKVSKLKNKEKVNSVLSDSNFKEEEEINDLELTGDSLADYYSGALQKFKLVEYPGYYCTIYIMKNEIITVHQESTHNWTTRYNFKDFLNKNELDKLLLDPDELINKNIIISKIQDLIKNGETNNK